MARVRLALTISGAVALGAFEGGVLAALINAVRPLSSGDDADVVEMCYTSADFREGVTSFLAKRKPVWSGK